MTNAGGRTVRCSSPPTAPWPSRSNGGFGASAPPAAELDIAISKGWRPKIVPRQLAPVLGKGDTGQMVEKHDGSKGWRPKIVPRQLAPVLGKGDTGQMVEKHDGRSMADHLEIALAELPKWARGDYWHLDQYVEELRSEAFVAFWRPGSGELGNQAPSLMLERYIGDIGAALKTLATPILADQSVDA